MAEDEKEVLTKLFNLVMQLKSYVENLDKRLRSTGERVLELNDRVTDLERKSTN